MKRRVTFLILAVAAFLGFFEFNLFYLLPQDISFGSYFSGIFYSLVGGESSKVIRINLYNKSLTLIDNGALVKQDKIAGAGHPKFSPTPTGNFKVLSKSKKVISYTGLFMPLSVRFKGAYYMHGIPTYRDGRLYYSEYSMGCIRIGPGLDQEIYDWADIGTNVQIYNASLVRAEDNPTVYYLTREGAKEPISSPEEFIGRGFRWQDVAVIPLIELDALPLANSPVANR
ncbi:MAG: L,D-transpeptidase [bacterium]